MCIIWSLRCKVGSPRNSVDTEFCWHGIPSTWNSVDTEFHRNRIPYIFFYFRLFILHGIPSTQNSTYFFYFRKFRWHGIPSKWNSVNTEFRNFFSTSVYSFAMLCYLFSSQLWQLFRGIQRNFADFKSQSLQYVWIWVF
jgi:hypothetical protein